MGLVEAGHGLSPCMETSISLQPIMRCLERLFYALLAFLCYGIRLKGIVPLLSLDGFA